MLNSFINFIEKNKLFSRTDNLLVAVSGGIDSAVLTNLCELAGYKFGICHCNFQLRGVDSKNDQTFVKKMAEEYQVPFYTTNFDTLKQVNVNKSSVQIEARGLRYKYFEKIAKEYNYHFILTAHHKDDCLETFFINLIRGTSIDGLTGIPIKRDNIVRPLLFATKKNIEDYANKNKIKFCEDVSNKNTDKYLRNKVRLKLMPLLEELSPSFKNILENNMERLSNVSKVYQASVEQISKAVIIENNNKNDIINLKKIKNYDNWKEILIEILKKYDFSYAVSSQLIVNIENSVGCVYQSPIFKALIDREQIVIKPIEEISNKRIDEIELSLDNSHINFNECSFKLQMVDFSNNFLKNSDNNVAFFDYDKLILPLKLRYWRDGDAFMPLGMKQRKKISDFFIDNKVNLFNKHNIPLLLSGKDIIWISGMRIDERYKIGKNTKTIVKIEKFNTFNE